MSWTEDREHEHGEDYGPPARRGRGCVCTDDMSPRGGCPGPESCPYACDDAPEEEEPEPDDGEGSTP